MRKRLKNKRRSCALCKPHKRGHANRWTARDAEALRWFERAQRAWEGRPPRSDPQRDPQRDEPVRGAA